MKKSIEVKGTSYPVDESSLMGDVNFYPVFALLKDLFDPDNIRKASIAIRNIIPKIPNSIISEGKINLFNDELRDFLQSVRELWFLVNLDSAVENQDFKREIKLAKAYAEFQEEQLRYNALKAELDEDEEMDSLPPANELKIEKLHVEYYQNAIELAKKEGNGERLEKLTARMKRVQDKVKTKGQVLAVNSENEALKKQVEQLQAQLQAQPTVVKE